MSDLRLKMEVLKIMNEVFLSRPIMFATVQELNTWKLTSNLALPVSFSAFHLHDCFIRITGTSQSSYIWNNLQTHTQERVQISWISSFPCSNSLDNTMCLWNSLFHVKEIGMLSRSRSLKSRSPLCCEGQSVRFCVLYGIKAVFPAA